MAYDYMDPMGNYTGYEETDEERRRRLMEEAAKNATPVTQTVKTNPVTGEQEMTIKGTPQDLSAANPRTPTVSGAVSPDQIFQRQIMAESAGQQYNPQGGILTSPKGAQGIAQIMPATAAQPGYGIKPATPEEIATKEGNMAFGERYKQGMLQAFGGDQQKATAAYNAGPGAIRRAEQQAAASGGTWTDYIPKETMAYLGKVFGNIMPTAQAGELSAQQRAGAPTITPSTTVAPSGSVISSATTPAVTPIAPTAQAQTQPAAPAAVSPYAFTATGGAPGLRMPDAMQQQQAMEQARRNQAVNEFQTATTNPDAMIDYMARKDVPDDLKTAMKINHFEALTAEKRQRDIEQKLTKTITENPQQLPRILNDKTEEGSIAKAFLYSLIGFKSGADAEVAKMNLPGKWTPAEDANGRTGMVLYSTSGKPLQGVNSDNTKMSPEQLSAFASGGLAKDAKQSLDVYKDPTGVVKGSFVLETRPGRTPYYKEVGTGRKATQEESAVLNKIGVGGTLETQRAKQIQELNIKLQGKTLEEKMTILRPYNQALVGAGQPAIDPSEVGIQAPQIGGGAAPAPGGAVVPSTPAVAGAAPVAPGQAPGAKRPTMSDIEAGKAGQKEIVKETAKTVAASADTQNLLNSINKVTGLIDSGNHNIGSTLSVVAGRGPIAQAIGSQLETPDAKNTKIIMDTVQKLAADGLKTLGSNPSTVDLQFWTRFKPDASSDPEFVKEWIQSRSDDLKRRLGYAESQTSAGGGQGNAPAVESTSASPADKARAELERRRKGQQ